MKGYNLFQIYLQKKKTIKNNKIVRFGFLCFFNSEKKNTISKKAYLTKIFYSFFLNNSINEINICYKFSFNVFFKCKKFFLNLFITITLIVLQVTYMY